MMSTVVFSSEFYLKPIVNIFWVINPHLRDMKIQLLLYDTTRMAREPKFMEATTITETHCIQTTNWRFKVTFRTTGCRWRLVEASRKHSQKLHWTIPKAHFLDVQPTSTWRRHKNPHRGQHQGVFVSVSVGDVFLRHHSISSNTVCL